VGVEQSRRGELVEVEVERLRGTDDEGPSSEWSRMAWGVTRAAKRAGPIHSRRKGRQAGRQADRQTDRQALDTGREQTVDRLRMKQHSSLKGCVWVGEGEGSLFDFVVGSFWGGCGRGLSIYLTGKATNAFCLR
jgi:hypothetical protein